MQIRVLGTAAGGGYPQWNCVCPLCSRVRRGESGLRRRLHASIAFSATGVDWYLINATPDIHQQIEAVADLHPGPGVRQTPIRGVLLTDAELDHTLGLFMLREGRQLDVYATRAVLTTLQDIFPVRRVLQPYTPLRWLEVDPDETLALDAGRLSLRAIPIADKRPRYAGCSAADGPWVVAYRVEDTATRGAVVYAPGVGRWDAALVEALKGAACAFVDGTFWSDDELIGVGASTLTARQMGHLPISGRDGTADRLSELSGTRCIYIHLNNTNPLLDERSDEHRSLSAAAIEVAWDGMEVRL